MKNILNTDVIDRLLPGQSLTVAEIQATYPERNLPKGAEVVRIAPSPTGFIHIGNIYAGFICHRLALQSNGVFFLRIEDTDRKREVAGARELIMEAMTVFSIPYNEGPIVGGDKGDYGPYIQSQRAHLYKAYVRQMLIEGKAYPCFMTAAEQEAMVERQKSLKIRPGYWGEWALWRDKTQAEVTAALDAGKPFVIRFRSTGDINKKRVVEDRIKGRKELPENDNDIVILKSDGLPTYHMAHIVDDHLMHTTTVLRADEWFPSVTLHMQLAEAVSVEPFTYAHIAPIQKMDGLSRRKLSKRKDPEANVEFYEKHGYAPVAVQEYMLNLANSNFEDWRRQNPDKPHEDFEFKLSNMQKNAGALLSIQKLEDISRDYLARLSPVQLYNLALPWTEKYDQDLFVALQEDPKYSLSVLAIERQNGKRKDLTKLADLRQTYGYFFDKIFAKTKNFDFAGINPEEVIKVVRTFLQSYDSADDQAAWFNKLKVLAEHLGYTTDTKAYRNNPDNFKGSVAEVAMVLRVALTGQNRSPDLHTVMRVMGEARLRSRFYKLEAKRKI